MLRVSEVAERLTISAQCVYQLIESGKLACHRFGLGRGAIRVSEDDLQEYIQSSRQGSKPPKKVARPRLKHIKVTGEN